MTTIITLKSLVPFECDGFLPMKGIAIMSSYSHRGYEHRNGGYGRRRRKSAGFRRKNVGASIAKAFAFFAGAVVVAALVFIFIKYLKPFINSFNIQDTETVATADTAATPDSPDIPAGEYDAVDDKVFVSGGSGYLMFKGIDKTAANYSAVMNSIASSVDENIPIYNMLIPTNTEFGLHSSYRGDTNSQKDNLDKITSGLMDRITNVSIYDTLNTHKNEYIYYRTDEHLTSLGAYYAFCEFAAAAGFEDDDIYTLDEWSERKGIIKRFEGELLQRTVDAEKQPHGNQELFNNADTIEFYRMIVDYDCYAIDPETGDRTETNLFSIDNAEEDPLSILPGKDTALLKITNLESDNSERLLVVKDSMAEPVLGYLVPGYGEIHIVDTQIYKENLSEYIRSNGITQVLIVSSITDANNSLYCQRLRDLFDSSITG